MSEHVERVKMYIMHLCFFLVIAGVAYHVIDMSSRRDVVPVSIQGVELETPTVRVGGELRFIWLFFRRKYCRSRVDQILLSAPDAKGVRTVLDRADIITGATELNEINKRRWIYQLPPDIPAGVYRLSHLYHSDCGDYIHSDRMPIIDFVVTR